MNKLNPPIVDKIVTINIVGLSILILRPSPNHFLKDDNKSQTDNNAINEVITSDYTSDSEGSGGDINVTLHQSLYDSTRKEILNTSDPSQNIVPL